MVECFLVSGNPPGRVLKQVAADSLFAPLHLQSLSPGFGGAGLPCFKCKYTTLFLITKNFLPIFSKKFSRVNNLQPPVNLPSGQRRLEGPVGFPVPPQLKPPFPPRPLAEHPAHTLCVAGYVCVHSHFSLNCPQFVAGVVFVTARFFIRHRVAPPFGQ